MNQTSEFKEALQTAFITGPQSLLKGDGHPEKQPQFILNTQGFEAVQIYLLAGLDLPKTDTEYEEWMSAKDFRDVQSVDSQLYTLAKQGLLSVSESCRRFNDQDMGELWSSPTLVIEYCENAINDLHGDPKSLEKYWEVLLDERYKEEGSEDEDFFKARKLAINVLDRLQAYAQDKKKETTMIRNQLIKFQNETKSNLNKVTDLDKRFNNNKVSQHGKSYNSITELLNSKLDNLKKESARYQQFKDDCENPAAAKFNDFLKLEHYTTFFGDSTLTKLNRLYETSQVKIEEATAQGERITALILHITRLDKICHGLMPKMQDAISALRELESLFDSQVSSFKELARLLPVLTDTTKSLDFDIRDATMQSDLDRAVKTFRKVKKLAEEFKQSIRAKR